MLLYYLHFERLVPSFYRLTPFNGRSTVFLSNVNGFFSHVSMPFHFSHLFS
jgi:hypothetical protein